MTRAQLTDVEWEFIEPYMPIGGYGPYPERLRQQFEGVVWRLRTGGQWREMPQEFGAWSTVSNRFRQWRDASVFEALLEGLIAETAKRGEVDLSLVSIDSTTVRAHHDAVGMHTSEDVLAALEKAAAEEEEARSKGAVPRDEAGRTVVPIPSGMSGERTWSGVFQACGCAGHDDRWRGPRLGRAVVVDRQQNPRPVGRGQWHTASRGIT